MTEKEERFCQEYLIDLNATQAAIRAGYSQKTAAEIGYENLRKPHIVDKVSALKQERSKRTQITADKVLKELAKLGFSNIQDYINDDHSVKNLKSISRSKSAAISSIKKTSQKIGKDLINESIEFKLYDKKGTLELIGKHIGFFEKDNQQKAEAGHTFNFDFGDDEGEPQASND
jgi:phage terminase small subunit